MGKIPAHAKQYAMTAFGKHIVNCMNNNDVRQKDLAERIGLTQQQVSYMKNHPGGITIDRMYDINAVIRLDMIQVLRSLGFSLVEIQDYFRPYFKDRK